MKITSSSLKFTIGIIVSQVLISITYFSGYQFHLLPTEFLNIIFPTVTILTLSTSIYIFNYLRKFLNDITKSKQLNSIVSIIIIYNFIMILYFVDFNYAGVFKIIDTQLFYKLYDLGSVLINLIYIFILLKVKKIDYSKEIKIYAVTQSLMVLVIILYYLFPAEINSNKKFIYGLSLLSMSPYISLLLLYFTALNRTTYKVNIDVLDSNDIRN